jgi:hypothetical protein
MASVALSQAALGGYLIVALFGVFILRRTYALTQGVRVSAVRLTVLPVLYVFLYAAEVAGVYFAGLTPGQIRLFEVAIGADVALVVAGVFLAYRVASRTVELYRPPEDPTWHYRVRSFLPYLYVALFFVRVGIETVVLGETPFTTPAPGALAALSAFDLYLLFAVDALWGFTTGLLLGRNWAVYSKWQEASAAPPLTSGA